jgi:hypothetical protein
VLVLIIPVALAGPFLLTWVLRIQPFVRNYCPILPFLAAALGWALHLLIDAIGRRKALGWSESTKTWVGASILLITVLPLVLSYPARLTRYRRDHEAQDGYFNYYAANYHPAEVVLHLKQSIRPGQPYVILYADPDRYPLGFYLRREGLPPQSTTFVSDTYEPVVFLITSARADYEGISAKSGIPAETLRSFVMVKDFGYYRLHRSPTLAGEKMQDSSSL